MSIGSRVWVRACAPVLLCALMGAVPAVAKDYKRHGRKIHSVRHQTVYRPLTVAAPVQAPAYDPFGGDPGANPLVLIGAPVYLAGQLAQLPFYAVGRLFGANPGFPN